MFQTSSVLNSLCKIATPNNLVEDVYKTLLIWRRHKDVLVMFISKILKTYCTRIQIVWLEVNIKTFWKLELFTLGNTFWTSKSTFTWIDLKALRRSYEGSVSKRIKCIVKTSSIIVTWSRDEDILKTDGSVSNLRIFLEVFKPQREQIEGVMEAFWSLSFQMFSTYPVNVCIS